MLPSFAELCPGRTPPAVLDPVLLDDAAVIPGPEDPPPRIPRSDGRHSGHSGRQAGARVKVVPSLGSILPAPAARSTPATVADPDHLQLPPAVLDPVLLDDAAVIPGPENPRPRIHAQTAVTAATVAGRQAPGRLSLPSARSFQRRQRDRRRRRGSRSRSTRYSTRFNQIQPGIQPDSTRLNQVFNRIQPGIQPDSTRYSTGFNQVFNHRRRSRSPAAAAGRAGSRSPG